MAAPFPNASYPNATYSLDFYGPGVKCKAANLSAEYCLLDECQDDEFDLAYFAMVPGRDEFTGKIIPVDISQPKAYNVRDPYNNFSDPIAPELWFGTRYPSQYASSTTSNERGQWRNSTCVLYNTSYSVDFAFNGGVQSTNIKNINYTEPMRWCRGVARNDSVHSSLHEVMAYQAIWVALSQQLVGTLGGLVSGSRTTQTSLIVSKELEKWASKRNISTAIVSIAGPRTLDVFIEELAQNITLSLFSDSDLW